MTSLHSVSRRGSADEHTLDRTEASRTEKATLVVAPTEESVVTDPSQQAQEVSDS